MIDAFITQAFTFCGAGLPFVLHGLFGAVCAWAAIPLIEALPKTTWGRKTFCAFTFIAVQPSLVFLHDPRQIVLLLCAVLMLGSLAREQAGTHPPLRCGIEGGIWAALALWINVLFLPVILGTTALFALFWLVTGHRNTLRALEGLALGLFVMSALAMGLTWGENWATERSAKTLTLPYVLAAAIDCGLWGVLTGYARAHSFMRRLMLSTVMLLAAFFALSLFAPELL